MAVVASAIAVLTACAGAGTSSSAQGAGEPAATAPAASVAASKAPPTACALVTEAEMSTILGAVVKGTADEGGGSTACNYKPATGMFPAVELKVDWGSASAAMIASGILSRVEPGITNPLDGLGDKAAQIGPALWVQVGEDLVTITSMGVNDSIAKAKQIVDTARPRMLMGFTVPQPQRQSSLISGSETLSTALIKRRRTTSSAR
jgi:hypothetical protein